MKWIKEHAALGLSLVVNIALTIGVVWQAHTIQVQRVLIYKLWIVLQVLTNGQLQ